MSQAPYNYRNTASVLHQIEEKCGRSPGEVKLLVVSKTMPPEVLKELYDECGIREFGENREPELAMKTAVLPEDIVWHFIGPLQSNKVRKVVKMASVIHSVSSVPLIERIERIAQEEGRTPEFLLEVNVSGETSKGGFSPDELFNAADVAKSCVNARWRGLMTMAPLDADDDTLEEIFCTLAKLKDQCEERCQITLPELSMGMSGDFPIAVSQGATIVRIGSRIFEGVEKITAVR